MCCAVAERAPGYGLGVLITELLAADAGGGWDALMVGLRALLSVLLGAPRRAAGLPSAQPEVRRPWNAWQWSFLEESHAA